MLWLEVLSRNHCYIHFC